MRVPLHGVPRPGWYSPACTWEKAHATAPFLTHSSTLSSALLPSWHTITLRGPQCGEGAEVGLSSRGLPSRHKRLGSTPSTAKKKKKNKGKPSS